MPYINQLQHACALQVRLTYAERIVAQATSKDFLWEPVKNSTNTSKEIRANQIHHSYIFSGHVVKPLPSALKLLWRNPPFRSILQDGG